jgi:putative ABC transport system ATP-binding protein
VQYGAVVGNGRSVAPGEPLPAGVPVRLTGLAGRDAAPAGTGTGAGVTLDVPAGQSVAVLSDPPAVAVDLLDAIAGLRRPGSGSVLVDGTGIGRLGGPELDRYRAGRGLVSARFPLLASRSVTDNVLAAAGSRRGDAAMRDRAASLLETVGVTGSLAQAPARDLPAGLAWRVLIARALLPAPRLVLAEDPAAAMTARDATAILDLLTDLHAAAGFTLVIAASRTQTAVRCQRLISLSGWTVTHDELTSGDDPWTRGRVDRIG